MAIHKALSLVAMFVISIIYSCIIREPSNFLVINVLINVPTRDLSAIWKHYRTNPINSLAQSILGRVVLILFTIVILMNIRLSLLDLPCFVWVLDLTIEWVRKVDFAILGDFSEKYLNLLGAFQNWISVLVVCIGY